MSEPVNDGGPAFSTDTGTMARDGRDEPWRPRQLQGLSMRDWFAGQALAGILASGPHDCDANGHAHDAYQFADAMLKARGADHG